MLDKTTAIPNIISKLDKLPDGHCIDLRTYKRNRSIVIVKRNQSQFYIIENGYETHRFAVTQESIKKTLKKLLKKEFSRSNKIRVYQMGEFNQQKINNTQLKKIWLMYFDYSSFPVQNIGAFLVWFHKIKML